MPMPGSPKRYAFKPTAYGSTHRPRRIPRWLTLLLTGIVLGAGGLLFLQKSYGPTRLTVEQSEQLHYDINSANLDRQRLQSQLNQQTHDLTTARSQVEAHSAELEQDRKTIAQLKNDVQLFVDAMPPDPRGTSPGIRAANFKHSQGQLEYQILIMQDAQKAAEFNGELQLLVAGRYTNGRSNTIALDPIDVKVERYRHVLGSAPLPDAFTPRQVTIRLTRQDNKKIAATRIIRVPR
jgi:hypothetical protein